MKLSVTQLTVSSILHFSQNESFRPFNYNNFSAEIAGYVQRLQAKLYRIQYSITVSIFHKIPRTGRYAEDRYIYLYIYIVTDIGYVCRYYNITAGAAMLNSRNYCALHSFTLFQRLQNWEGSSIRRPWESLQEFREMLQRISLWKCNCGVGG